MKITIEDMKRYRSEIERLYHGPVFPLKFTRRFKTWRIEDAQGNVVIEASGNADMIDLEEAREGMIEALNRMPDILDALIDHA